jgi:hypothetical protein
VSVELPPGGKYVLEGATLEFGWKAGAVVAGSKRLGNCRR